MFTKSSKFNIMLRRRHIGGGSVNKKYNPSIVTFLIIILVVIALIYLVTKCSYQNVEKLIPLFTSKAICHQPLTLYQSSQNKREWLAVQDHCRAIDLIIRRGKNGERYNIGSGVERSVEEIADTVLRILDKPQSLKIYVPDRPGHDRRYLLDSRKIRQELGWQPETKFEIGLENTIAWYIDNRKWWQHSQEDQIREDQRIKR